MTSIGRQTLKVSLHQRYSIAGKQAQLFSHGILVTFEMVYRYMLMPFAVVAHMHCGCLKLCGFTKQCACSTTIVMLRIVHNR